ncbi:MAG TPA: hypothetical protein VFR03_12940 [Thermoanaerobaculia bacterium]|nr:hypothetical protein [Thermoanaerobaculia bacterium]
MRTIQEAAPSTFCWQQPQAFKCEYELRAGDELLGAIRKTRRFSAAMEAEIGDTRFTFEPAGFFRSRVAVREADAAGEPAVFQAGFCGGGQLLLPDGRSYRWKMTSFWGSRWAFLDDSDRPLVSFRPRNRVFRTGAGVEIGPGALRMPELPVLVLLGWYLLLRIRQDSASA